MRKILCAWAMLGLVGMAAAAEHWRGAGWGGDGTSWNDAANWDDSIPSATTWDVNRSGEQGTPSNHDIHITADGTCGTGTIYDQSGYTVDLTVENGVTMVNSGTLSYYAAGDFTVKSGATYDMRYGQLGLESGSLTVTVEADALLNCSTLRHNNGAMVDVYGELRAWTVSRISAEGTYRLAVRSGGLFRVDSAVPTSGGWSDDGKVTQYIGSVVMLVGDHAGHYTDLVQMGEEGYWEVWQETGYTYIRLRAESNVCDFSVTPDAVDSLPGAGCPGAQNHALTVTNITSAGGPDLNYTVVQLDADGVETDVPWLAIDKTAGGPLAANGGTDTVTVTVDYTQIGLGANIVRLRFTSDCDPYEVHDVEIIAPFILDYHGNVDPETENAGGPGLRFTERAGDSSDADVYRNLTPNSGLAVQADPEAEDGYALQILDGDDRKLKLRTAPSLAVGGNTGATIVGRVRCTYKSGTSGENLTIWHDGGGTVGYHWSGWGDNGTGAGYIKETARGADYTREGETQEWYSKYHVIRACMGSVEGNRTVRLYLDENPDPVIDIPNAGNVASALDSMGFGTGSTGGQQIISFDWVTGTNAGMFAPGEEVACIGRSLVPVGTPGACCLPDRSCVEIPEAQCTGSFKGGGTACDEVLCCPVPFADVDNDQDLDQVDFAEVQRCLTLGAPEQGVSSECTCLDHDGDGDVDEFDMSSFIDCALGPNVAVTSESCYP